MLSLTLINLQWIFKVLIKRNEVNESRLKSEEKSQKYRLQNIQV